MEICIISKKCREQRGAVLDREMKTVIKYPAYAGMMELADMQDLGSCASACGFDSHYPYFQGQNAFSGVLIFSYPEKIVWLI